MSLISYKGTAEKHTHNILHNISNGLLNSVFLTFIPYAKFDILFN